MAGCSSCGQGGNISPESIRRWTESLSKLMLSPNGRRKFHDYLESEKMEKDHRHLEFLEMCDSFLNPSPTRSITTMTQEAKLIEKFAVDHSNFDSAQLVALHTAVQSGDTQTIVGAIEVAKKIAEDLLEDKYRKFSEDLQGNN